MRAVFVVALTEMLYLAHDFPRTKPGRNQDKTPIAFRREKMFNIGSKI